MKVLFVDDDALMRRLGEFSLGELGNMSVVTAVDGYEALARAEEISPDVIVLDFEMPGMNGDEVLKVLRSSLTTRSIPVVFLTGIDNEEELNALIAAGAVGYIVKPFDPRALAGVLESILAEVSDHELLS
jgi:CheY-like chemotaxis protein